MKQQTLSGFGRYGKTTPHAQFLADMGRIIPWVRFGRLPAPPKDAPLDLAVVH